jgi:hypothetical protein
MVRAGLGPGGLPDAGPLALRKPAHLVGIPEGLQASSGRR